MFYLLDSRKYGHFSVTSIFVIKLASSDVWFLILLNEYERVFEMQD